MNPYVSKTAFDALSVDQLESDTEESAVATPSSRKRAKRALKAKASAAELRAADASPAVTKAAKQAASEASTAAAQAAEQAKRTADATAAQASEVHATLEQVQATARAQTDEVKERATKQVKQAATTAESSAAALSSATKQTVHNATVQARETIDEAASAIKNSKRTADKVTDDASKEAASAAAASKAYWKKIQERTFFSFVMMGAFIAILLMGPPYLIGLVLLLEMIVYQEITGLFNIPGRTSLTDLSRNIQPSPTLQTSAVSSSEAHRDRLWGKAISWYFFAVCNFFLCGESLSYYFKHILFVNSPLLQFAQHHRFISFLLYIFGFMAFVSNLKPENLSRQFALFCWVHMSLLFIAFSAHFLVANILEGIIWFFLPVSLVICNDSFAYVCGMLFGRTQLISLSPKKTVEGFVGALIITVIFSWFCAGILQQFNYMVCPAVNLGMNAFSKVSCEVNPVFITRESLLPHALASLASTVAQRPITTFHWSPFQFHALVLGAFASLVAPFGGFFASGFKRAFNIKDFGASIPGHGGLTDRVDCQFIMGMFTHVYVSSLVRGSRVTVGTLMQMIVTSLPLEEQTELLRDLTAYLATIRR